VQYTSLDTIITGLLLQRRYPIHFYAEFLIHAYRIYEEEHFDTLKNVRTAVLQINSYYAAELPCDFMDWVRIGYQNGPFVKPMVQRPGFNRRNNFDTTTGDKIPYPEPAVDEFANTFIGSSIFGWNNFVTYNDKMENTGRLYGSGKNRFDTFSVIAGPTGKNQIQFDNNVGATCIVMDYISDGTEIDNATMINPYAKAAIEAGIIWKMKANTRTYSQGEVMQAQREFDHQTTILRGRMNDLTMDDLRAIIQRRTQGSLK
jgi:hypothetical protein